jgi:hypothetical protein
MNRRAMAAGLLLLALPTLTWAQDAEQSLLQAESGRFTAEAARDMPALADALGDDLRYGHASGEVQDKRAYLAYAPHAPVSTSLTDRQAQVFGDTGITRGVMVMIVSPGDAPRKASYLGVYRRRGGRWRLIEWQTTAMK